MTDFNVSTPRGTTVFQASADSMGPGSIAVNKVKAGGPGSGRRPEDMINQSHKHMYEIATRPTGKAGDPDINVTKVTGNSAAHAMKQFKEGNPGIKGGNNAHHIASKAPDGSWRVPTVNVKEGGFGALPIEQWHHMQSKADKITGPKSDSQVKKEGKHTVQAPDDLAREKGKAPSKSGKIISKAVKKNKQKK